MAGTILTSVVAFAGLLHTTNAFNCSIPPLYVDIHKREVHGAQEFQYGSFIGIGDAAQNQSIWPSLRQNETTFASDSFCSNSNLTNCMSSTGGNYNSALSSSWKPENGTQTTSITNNDGLFVSGKDTLHMYTHYFMTSPAWETLLHDMPVKIAKSGSKNPGVVGIGSASTILQRLFDVGLIAARTYSLYLGTGFERAGGKINGSNTFGGFDAGRFVQPVHTYKMDMNSADYLPVTVSDIIIDDPNDPAKQKLSILDDEPFEARITTDRYPMLLPASVSRRLMPIMNAGPANSVDASLRLARPFNGTMTIKLSDGFNITLPAETLNDVSGLTPVEATPANYNGPYYLSAAWLSQVYLMMDFETKQFHLAKAITAAQYIMPTIFCPATVPVPHDYNRPLNSPFEKNGMIGAVVGGVVGGLALFAIFIWCWVAYKRRMLIVEQQKRWSLEEKAMELARADLQRRSMSPVFPESTLATPFKYEPVDDIREMTPSPVSDISSLEGGPLSSRPPSLRRDDHV